MSFVARMHEYVLAGGGVPEYVAQLVEFEQKIGGKFKFQPEFDGTFARGLLGLDGKSRAKLPDHEKLRLSNLLRRAGKISDEELSVLGMVARSIDDPLDRALANTRWNRTKF